MKEVELAYTAGIVDGEGSIGIHLCQSIKEDSKRGQIRLRVQVDNTNKQLIEWLRLGYGGHCSTSHKGGNRKTVYKWAIGAKAACSFLKLIFPYLRIKKMQAEIAIQFQGQRPQTGKHLTEKESAVAEAQRIVMANLNKRGKVSDPLEANKKT